MSGVLASYQIRVVHTFPCSRHRVPMDRLVAMLQVESLRAVRLPACPFRGVHQIGSCMPMPGAPSTIQMDGAGMEKPPALRRTGQGITSNEPPQQPRHL